jgi:hypothetical protein
MLGQMAISHIFGKETAMMVVEDRRMATNPWWEDSVAPCTNPATKEESVRRRLLLLPYLLAAYDNV